MSLSNSSKNPNVCYSTPLPLRLLSTVKLRRPMEKKANYEEKVNHLLAPYTLVHELKNIANRVLSQNNSSDRLSQASLRDRFCLLLTNFGILRGESLFKADLSDLASIVDRPGTCQESVVLILQIAIGKVNKGKTLYGRVMRHKDVELCPVGALAMYLFHRFQVAKEEIDLSSNSKWFDVKLL